MDGLVTNIALIAGVGGGGASPRAIVLTGVAGTVAGAISMALGEYMSVRTQNEQVAAELRKERREIARHPAAEQRELADAWRARGLT
ncbi:MAG: VIT1/CCC1 transporter family protein, partial [Micromonosporaceae bacterium]